VKEEVEVKEEEKAKAEVKEKLNSFWRIKVKNHRGRGERGADTARMLTGSQHFSRQNLFNYEL